MHHNLSIYRPKDFELFQVLTVTNKAILTSCVCEIYIYIYISLFSRMNVIIMYNEHKLIKILYMHTFYTLLDKPRVRLLDHIYLFI